MSTQIEPAHRQLPASLPRQVERMGYQILSALDRLGFAHVNRDGSVFTVRFSDAALLGDELALYSVDCERLWHFSIGDLSQKRVVEHLSAVVRKPVRANTVNGLMYVVRLKPPLPPARLPNRAALDLDQRPAGELMLPLGAGRNGPLWRSLLQVGHTLLVGATGAGKSSFIHSALAALLAYNAPEQLRVVLLDPKRAELTPWAHVPHLMSQVAHTPRQATLTLSDVVDEIERRGDLLAGLGARDVMAYNRRQGTLPLPIIWVIIDEVLDLTLMAGERSELGRCLKIIATRGRSAGVILWCATQHASAVSGLPRVVNVNLGSRVVFRVNDRSAAQVAGCPGAEHIERGSPGRLLAKLDGQPVELQGYFLSDDRLMNLARGLSGQPAT